jgi:hypothetical protein
MPITFSIDRTRPRVHTTATGRVTFDEIMAHLDRTEAVHVGTYPQLLDARDATTGLSAGQVRALADRAGSMARRGLLGPTAFAISHDASFGMARMYELLVEDRGVAVGVFRTLDEAERWLATASPAPDG